jgi:hypothetical protein
MAFWSILRPLEIFYGRLVYFVVIWCISPRFGILYQEKSGNPGWVRKLCRAVDVHRPISILIENKYLV